MALKRFFNIDAPPPPSQPEGLSQRLVQDLARSTRYDAASIEGLGELFFNFADSTGMLDKTRFIERLGTTPRTGSRCRILASVTDISSLVCTTHARRPHQLTEAPLC